jgi:hypothetical protein
MIEWNKENLANRSDGEIKSLRENASKRGAKEVVILCDEVLASRKPAKKARATPAVESRAGYYVAEFHLVCPNELGVTRNDDKTIWSGTWVVAEEHAAAAEKYGSLVALHSAKAEHSYIQGTVKGWRKSPRQRKYSGEADAKTPFGIDFLIALQDNSSEWKGDGSGEKGYLWAPTP